MKEKPQILDLFASANVIDRHMFGPNHPQLFMPYSDMENLDPAVRRLKIQGLLAVTPVEQIKYRYKNKRRKNKTKLKLHKPQNISKEWFELN